MYSILIVGTALLVALGVPLIEFIMRRIRPLTPEQEGFRRRLDEARRRGDRFPF
jgi:hypothetical protein